MNTRKNDAKAEKMQQRREAGSLAERFPQVAGIVINMTYSQKGVKSLLRTFNFSPGSYAFFMLDCLSKDCVDGGFDLTNVITTMIRNRKGTAKGTLSCQGNDPAAHHADIVYEVAIQYN